MTHPADYNPRRTAKTDKVLGEKLNFQDINFPVKFQDI